MRYFLLLFVLSHFFCSAISQNNYVAYTTANGLPSNNIYKILEDNRGFLWLTTEAGIVRFDGKHFQVFTTEHGLPDNEVLDIAKEADGTIWVNCFKQTPAYFDEIKNRFIQPIDQSIVNKFAIGIFNRFYTLNSGGIVYDYSKGNLILIKKQLINNTQLSGPDINIHQIDTTSAVASTGYNNEKYFYLKFYTTKKETITDSVLINFPKYKKSVGFYAKTTDKLFCFQSLATTTKLFQFTIVHTNPLEVKKDSFVINSKMVGNEFNPYHYYGLNTQTEIEFYNKKTFAIEKKVSGNYLANSYCKDSKGNEWIGSSNKGLILYKQKYIQSVNPLTTFNNNNFISIAAKNRETIIAGNYNGQIVEIRNGIIKPFQVINNKAARIKKILTLANNIYSFSEQGIKLNYTTEIKNQLKGDQPFAAKTAIIFNDSIILAGLVTALISINTNTNKAVYVHDNGKRITAIAKANDSIIYYGSLDGLYKYNLKTKINTGLQKKEIYFTERIVGLYYTPNNLLWIATAAKGIIVVQDEKIVATISKENGLISNICRTIIEGKNNTIWVGTNTGISAIKYLFKNNQLTHDIQNFTEADGLPSNEVNEIMQHNDTIYAATSKGIAVIPANAETPSYTIPVIVTKIKIGLRDTSIYTTYRLPYNNSNISLGFSAVDLSGHYNYLLYAITDTTRWIKLENNFLDLTLNPGTHTLYVKAVDTNGNSSSSTLQTVFIIEAPFWKKFWFWLLIYVAILSLSILLIVKRSRRIRKHKLDKKLAEIQTASLEQQAFTSLMNPHFMFNALNSIQHYINVQDRQNANFYLSNFASLIRKNFESAQLSFICLDQELENIKVYLRLEQMRFSHELSFHINIDKKVDVENWMIPTMLLQPLIENALLHGLMPSAIKAELEINIKEENDELVLVIIDNGIGFENSKLLKQDDSHKSHALSLITKRLESLASFTKQPISLQMKPAFTSLQNPGNAITIVIPAQLYTSWVKTQSQKITTGNYH